MGLGRGLLASFGRPVAKQDATTRHYFSFFCGTLWLGQHEPDTGQRMCSTRLSRVAVLPSATCRIALYLDGCGHGRLPRCAYTQS